MSTERKDPRRREQALNDATSGQIGKEPTPEPMPDINKRNSDNPKKKIVRS